MARLFAVKNHMYKVADISVVGAVTDNHAGCAVFAIHMNSGTLFMPEFWPDELRGPEYAEMAQSDKLHAVMDLARSVRGQLLQAMREESDA